MELKDEIKAKYPIGLRVQLNSFIKTIDYIQSRSTYTNMEIGKMGTVIGYSGSLKLAIEFDEPCFNGKRTRYDHKTTVNPILPTTIFATTSSHDNGCNGLGRLHYCWYIPPDCVDVISESVEKQSFYLTKLSSGLYSVKYFDKNNVQQSIQLQARDADRLIEHIKQNGQGSGEDWVKQYNARKIASENGAKVHEEMVKFLTDQGEPDKPNYQLMSTFSNGKGDFRSIRYAVKVGNITNWHSTLLPEKEVKFFTDYINNGGNPQTWLKERTNQLIRKRNESNQQVLFAIETFPKYMVMDHASIPLGYPSNIIHSDDLYEWKTFGHKVNPYYPYCEDDLLLL